ncbi:predicted protein [Coccidioides posadasii str. Silveira]|uniref:Predicted protein n=1 Tax=Coccidioides posadasii (strain RMSCC 757 / Silveira) TaxID=443226 RepID=E9D8J5_COCPS|nr:predicted protein [Coccidioides posadasii str. Silveira]
MSSSKNPVLKVKKKVFLCLLLHLQEKYYFFNAADPHCLYNIKYLVSEAGFVKNDLSELLYLPSSVCAVLSQVKNEIGNVHVLLDYLTTYLMSETKTLQDSQSHVFYQLSN